MKTTHFPAMHVVLPQKCEGERAPFYLAAEEYIASHLPTGNYLFTWQLAPTVVMGRNQDAQVEIDLGFCWAEGIDVIRRKSGGGSVYADRGNIMISLITGKSAVEPLFEEYAHVVASCLNDLGAEVEVSGRNDIIMKGGGKICGNAFYHLAQSNIVHGTMLFDTDARLMSGALTPERAKLLSKGVKSVQSRISLLKDVLTNLSVSELRQHICQSLTGKQVVLGEEDIKCIREIEQTYYEASFLRLTPTEKAPTQHCWKRIEGCGTLMLKFDVEQGEVKSVNLSGDYFELGDAQVSFNEAFTGCRFAQEELCQRARQHLPNKTIRGLDTEELCSLIGTMFKSI